MRIDHITRRFVSHTWGGTESSVLAIAQQLHARGHETQILTSLALSDDHEESISHVTVRRFSYFYPYLGLREDQKCRLDQTAGNLFSFSLLKYLLTEPPPDLYHLHTGKRMGGIVRFAARRMGIPYIVSLHGGVCDVPEEERARWTHSTSGSWEWGRLLGAGVGARRVLDDAAAILCVNRSEQKALQQEFPGKRVLWTPNTVDVAHFGQGSGPRFRARHGFSSEAKVILSVGRVDEQKNQLASLQAFERLASSIPQARLVFAGAQTSPCYAERLKTAIRRSAYAGRILCLDNVMPGSQELTDMYAAADVFLLSSIHEPFGIVLLEAWAAGLPIVAPRVGGIPSFVEDGHTGLLFAPGDIEAAAQHVEQILLNAGLAERLRNNALTRVKRFDTRNASLSLIRLYEEVQREHSFRS